MSQTPFRMAGDLPLTGYARSPKGSRGSRLGREREMGEEIYGGGYGMGNYVNIENNPALICDLKCEYSFQYLTFKFSS